MSQRRSRRERRDGQISRGETEAAIAEAVVAIEAKVRAEIAEMLASARPQTDECPAFVRESIARTMKRIRPPLGQRHQRKLDRRFVALRG